MTPPRWMIAPTYRTAYDRALHALALAYVPFQRAGLGEMGRK